MTGGTGDPIQALELRIQRGEIAPETLEQARDFWQARLASGFHLPNGELVVLAWRDLHHILFREPRILRQPDRLVLLLQGMFELRTADQQRRVALSYWLEEAGPRYGYAILSMQGDIITMHVVGQRAIRQWQRKGSRLWTP